ncbi:MAG: TIGR02444 family protein [Halieaceae bacterium]|jgi:uncharacterized protein (TIGR02444 family)|nr:TIGR02444 family protein [Halieaceae bacterium]
MIIGADSTDAVPANPLWTFSLSLYRREGVADLCLDLQDRLGLDVNLVLYAAFAAARGVSVGSEDLAAVEATILHWRDSILRPLRLLRRQLQDSGDERDARRALLSAELALEQVQQSRMWEARQPAGDWPAAANELPVRGNLAALARHAAIDEGELEALASALEHLLPALLAEL